MTPTNPSSYNSDCNCLSDRNSKKIRHREVAMIVCGGVRKEAPRKTPEFFTFGPHVVKTQHKLGRTSNLTQSSLPVGAYFLKYAFAERNV